MSDQQPFGVNVKFVVKPERRDEFLKVMNSDLWNTREREQFSLQSVFGEDVDKKNVFYLHEEYLTQEQAKQSGNPASIELFSAGYCVESPAADEFFLAHDAPSSKIPNRPDTFCLNVELNIKPAFREEFLRVIQKNKRGSDEEEPLCLQYSYGEAVTSANTFYFHEQYTGGEEGLEGFKAHQAAPHFQAWEVFASKVPTPFTKPPVVRKYRSIADQPRS